MVVDLSKLDLRERPLLVLKNTTGTPIGTLGSAMNITPDIKYNEVSTLEFYLPASHDGTATPHYDAVIGMRTIELQDIGQFVLVNPKETDDGIKKGKQCKAYSLEYEFTFKKISLASSTYNFWNPTTPDSTLLQIILEMMPSWRLGSVDDALVGKYRTFEVSDENLYNFMKGTIQNAYNCVFDFDTMERLIHVRSASSHIPTNPVYISNHNLASEITVEENTENIVTRLDVNGADGVNIRDINPMGTNQIINLDYFMNTDNFDSDLIAKYEEWKDTYARYQQPYYNYSVEYALQVMRKVAEQAALTELQGEMVGLENEQAVIIQSVANKLMNQSALDDVNERIAKKQEEIEAQKAQITEIETQAGVIYEQLSEINEKTRFSTFFTEDEYLQLDRYIKDDSVSESSFVITQTDSYTNEDTGNQVSNLSLSINGAGISMTQNESGKDIYDITGGKIATDFLEATVIRAAMEVDKDGKYVLTAYLGEGKSDGNAFPKGCISITGEGAFVEHDCKAEEQTPEVLDGTALDARLSKGYLYFTRNTSEYEKRAVAWDLFEYGNEILEKISQPSYNFSITSSNFFGIEEFTEFKNKIRMGEKLYVGLDEGKTLEPICIGLKVDFDAPESLTLEFSDTYTSGDSSFLLADLLEQSVSMGKSVDLNKYSYSAFMDSGASTKVKDFMSAALDVSKNAILSSKNQAISWGDSGIRLRKWADDTHTNYEPKQVWLNNNSILMTGNNWATAEIAIGNFRDENLGECWGVVAPNIVGTLLAGSNLVIESAKQDGGVSVFKVDAEGCFLHNSSLSITSEDTNTHILLDPSHGLIIGKYPLFNGARSASEIDDDKKLFYADTEGNLVLKGTVYANAGEFTGKVTATEGYIGQPSQGWTIGSGAIYNGKAAYADNTQGVYIGTDGISLGDSTHYIRANKNGNFFANNVDISGRIVAKEGVIGGCTISNGVLQVGDANITGLTASKITTGTMSADRISGGSIDASDVTIVNLSASNIKSGTINGNLINVTNINASNITGGTLDFNTVTASNIRADSITVGQLTATQISGLPASKITNGTFADARIPELNASKIASGTFADGRIPKLDASKIASGTFASARIPSIAASKLTGSTINGHYCNWGDVKVLTRVVIKETIADVDGDGHYFLKDITVTPFNRTLYLLLQKSNLVEGNAD